LASAYFLKVCRSIFSFCDSRPSSVIHQRSLPHG
jgi:hypothetical protein